MSLHWHYKIFLNLDFSCWWEVCVQIYLWPTGSFLSCWFRGRQHSRCSSLSRRGRRSRVPRDARSCVIITGNFFNFYHLKAPVIFSLQWHKISEIFMLIFWIRNERNLFPIFWKHLRRKSRTRRKLNKLKLENFNRIISQ